jgi:pimeloyl-ACP methyl ester carboxylesterase
VRSYYVEELDAFIRYLELPGDDPPHVWLHGLGRSSTVLAHVAAHARLRGRRSLLVDLLGFGISDKPDRFSYSLDDHAAIVVRLLEGLGVAGCVLVGHSLGGTVAVLAAARRPELVSALVVAEGNLDPGGAPMSQEIVAHSEEDYLAEEFGRALERMRADARANPRSIVAARLGGQQLVTVVPDTGHSMMFENPDGLAHAIADFLEQV